MKLTYHSYQGLLGWKLDLDWHVWPIAVKCLVCGCSLVGVGIQKFQWLFSKVEEVEIIKTATSVANGLREKSLKS